MKRIVAIAVIAVVVIAFGLILRSGSEPITLAAAVDDYVSGLEVSGTSYEVVQQTENEAEVIVYLEIVENGQIQRVPKENLLLRKDDAGNWGIVQAATIVIPPEQPPEENEEPQPTPAIFEVSNLVVNPSEVEVGEPVEISVTVKNVGDLDGTYTVELRIDGEIQETKDITLAGGATETVSFTATKDARGTYAVGVDGLQRTLTVLMPATFEVSNLQYPLTDVEIRNLSSPPSVWISCDIRNKGDVQGTYTITLEINGITESTKAVTLAGGEARKVSFTIIVDTSQTYNVSVDGLTGAFRARDTSWWNDAIISSSVMQVMDDYMRENVFEVISEHLCFKGEQYRSYGFGPYDREGDVVVIEGNIVYGTVPNLKEAKWLAKIDLNAYQVVEFREITE